MQKRYAFKDRDLQSLAEDVADVARALGASRFASEGVTVEGLAFTSATTTSVNHGLGYKPRGFFVVRALTADPGLFCTPANWEARTSRSISITATASATADVRFF